MNDTKHKLKLDSGKEVRFDHPIAQVVKFPGVLVVRVEAHPKKVLNENVFGVDVVSGKVIWQIEPLPGTGVKDSPYVSIGPVSSKSTLVLLQNWNGVDLTVRAENGEIVKRGFGK